MPCLPPAVPVRSEPTPGRNRSCAADPARPNLYSDMTLEQQAAQEQGRREQGKERRRRRILEAAAQLVEAEGLDGLTMRRLSDAADVELHDRLQPHRVEGGRARRAAPVPASRTSARAGSGRVTGIRSTAHARSSPGSSTTSSPAPSCTAPSSKPCTIPPPGLGASRSDVAPSRCTRRRSATRWKRVCCGMTSTRTCSACTSRWRSTA